MASDPSLSSPPPLSSTATAMAKPQNLPPLCLSSRTSKPWLARKCRLKPDHLTDTLIFTGGAMAALLLIYAIYSLCNPTAITTTSFSEVKPQNPNPPLAHDCHHPKLQNPFSTIPTFYDDPNLSYRVEKPIKNWDQNRRQWMEQNPSLSLNSEEKVLLVTGSQAKPCRNPVGDHLLLRFFKNKVDYCRLHGYDIFYNTLLFQPKMFTFWSKIPTVKAAMLAHPEVEWVYWVDSDAAFTDMEFKLPLQKYRDHNLIVHGWDHLVYQNRSWTSLNAGIFLIRNCQWSMDFMEVWASFGPQSPNYEEAGKTQTSVLSDRLFSASDDQSALVYLLLTERDKWGDKIFLENSYYFEGYWVEIIGTYENITRRYEDMEKAQPILRRRKPEKLAMKFGELREPYLKEAGNGRFSWRRPFVTHFTGCQPCSGDHNKIYSGENCWKGMERALNFADNQVLRNFGFVHEDLSDSASVKPLPFDFPASVG
ncbi:galactomannan galactosyltransferase 1 [Amborella trichopoda]|uniref:Glycosyltransferase 7 n=1 Tax=Amborella trichopoda TaxID=13333 RepID=U5D808_AMBTC|nr:galactomannan galactosyltransferase 1 [Amborella trichopoda]ERN18594.1 hypothetical protein AMTR_s00065p00144450 [Amborella trichopoda]|eukprot:XP_006857127.1 galactomannan galactosyltransferase 1 [Amborella trichopoda]